MGVFRRHSTFTPFLTKYSLLSFLLALIILIHLGWISLFFFPKIIWNKEFYFKIQGGATVHLCYRLFTHARVNKVMPVWVCVWGGEGGRIWFKKKSNAPVLVKKLTTLAAECATYSIINPLTNSFNLIRFALKCPMGGNKKSEWIYFEPKQFLKVWIPIEEERRGIILSSGIISPSWIHLTWVLLKLG